MDDIYDQMVEAWQGPVVARAEVRHFTGGAINGKTLANLEAKGVGPPKLKFRNKTLYETRKLAAWLRQWNNEKRNCIDQRLQGQRERKSAGAPLVEKDTNQPSTAV